MRVLLVDDAVPRAALGAGHPRGLAVLQALAAVAASVAVVGTQADPGTDVPAEALPANVAVLPGPWENALMQALAARVVDVLWVGRPHNLASVERLARLAPDAFSAVRVVYDAEAVFALRDARRRALDGAPMSDTRQRSALRQEFHPAYIAAAVAAVSPAERDAIASLVPRPVHVLSYPAPILVPEPAPRERERVLFVGNLVRPDEPNGEGLRWLLREAWPQVRDATLEVAGRGAVAGGWLGDVARDRVRLLGSVPDLAPQYAAARVFVAPTRFAAGIPLKVIEAAQHGVPVVATPLIADLLGWRDGVELIVGRDGASFAAGIDRLREDDRLWATIVAGAHAALRRDHAPERFAATVAALLGRAAAAQQA